MSHKMITVDLIMENNPCDDYDRDMVQSIIGDGKTIIDYLDLPSGYFVSGISDKMWVLLLPGVLDDAIVYRIAIYAATQAYPIFAKAYPGDSRPGDAIRARRKWLHCRLDDYGLAAASAAASAAARAAWAAASDAAGDAASDAAWAAGWAAARAAAWAAARDAGRAAAWDAASDAASDAAWNKIYIFAERLIRYSERLELNRGMV